MTGQPISLDVLAVWFTTTQRLLLDARNSHLPQDAQDGLLELLGQADIATGPHTP